MRLLFTAILFCLFISAHAQVFLPRHATATTRPANAKAGMLYFDTDSLAYVVFDGAAWGRLGRGGGGSGPNYYPTSFIRVGDTIVIGRNGAAALKLSRKDFLDSLQLFLTAGPIKVNSSGLRDVLYLDFDDTSLDTTLTGKLRVKPNTFAPLSHLHSAADITSGTLPIARGGTGLSTIGAVGQVPRVAANGTSLEYYTPTASPSLSQNHIGVGNSSNQLSGSSDFQFNSNRVLSFNNTSVNTWADHSGVVESGGASIFFGNVGDMWLSSNAYFNGGWRYKTSGPAANIGVYNGEVWLRTQGAGNTGDAFAFNLPLKATMLSGSPAVGLGGNITTTGQDLSGATMIVNSAVTIPYLGNTGNRLVARNSSSQLYDPGIDPASLVPVYANYYESSSQTFSSSSTPSVVTLSTTVVQTSGVSIASNEITFTNAGDYEVFYSGNATASGSANMEIRLQKWNGSAWVDITGTKIAFSMASGSGIHNAANAYIFTAAAGDKIRFGGTATSSTLISLASGNTDYSFSVKVKKL